MRSAYLPLLTALALACAATAPRAPAPEPIRSYQEVLRASFKAHGQAGLERLDQDPVQAACSRPSLDGPLPEDAAAKLVAAQQATLVYPADGVLMGDWKNGEAIAQSGVGMQYSDDPKRPSGGNCYACHQLSAKEVAFGTLGPSLYQYGKMRGQSEVMQRYTYGRIYNPQAFAPCSSMPRFGHQKILTPEQIKDVVALLLDPGSPVNQ
jgi:sulfur-oxidizing protein SoxX